MSAGKLWAPVEGKYGRTRDGRKVGPLCRAGVDFSFADKNTSQILFWHRSGSAYDNLGDDLVSEWSNEPGSAQPIDFSKISAGDKVRLGGDFEVLRCDPKDKSRPVCVRMFGDLVAWLHVSTIAEHLPAAIIEPGNRVVFNGREWDVVAIKDAVDGRRAILFDEMTDNIGFPMLSELTRIDGKAA